MEYHSITKPIGLHTPCKEIENTCGQAYLYRKCGLRPKHLVLPLDSGSGRTTFLDYMTQMYKLYGILPFTSSRDEYMEVILDASSPDQINKTFDIIDNAADYSNEYSNIVGMDISDVALHPGETQTAVFLKRSKDLCKHATVVFFIPSIPDKNEDKLLKQLCETIDNIKCLEVEPYSPNDLCTLIINNVANRGIKIQKDSAFRGVLLDMISELGVSSFKDAIMKADILAGLAGTSLTIDEKSVTLLMKTPTLMQKGAL